MDDEMLRLALGVWKCGCNFIETQLGGEESALARTMLDVLTKTRSFKSAAPEMDALLERMQQILTLREQQLEVCKMEPEHTVKERKTSEALSSCLRAFQAGEPLEKEGWGSAALAASLWGHRQVLEERQRVWRCRL